MAQRRWFLLVALLALVVVLIVLAGLLSDDASAEPDVTPPVADAGPDQLVDQVRAVHLDGSGSSDDVGIDRYVWSFEHAGEPVTLEGEHAYFMFRLHGEYAVTLNVTDEAGNWDTDELTLTVLTPPGEVTNITIVPRSGWVELAWEPPEDDGGANVTSSIIYRGLAPDDLRPYMTDFYIQYWHWDPIVENGETYYYAIAAVNAVGVGPVSRVLNATPMAVPAPPQDLKVRSKGGRVLLSWTPPAEEKGRVPVTGYEVHRGTDPDWLYDTFDVGLNTSFVDKDVKEGKRYFYAVGARSELGSSNVTEVMNVTLEEVVNEGSWVTVVVLMVPLVGIFGALAWWARRQ